MFSFLEQIWPHVVKTYNTTDLISMQISLN